MKFISLSDIEIGFIYSPMVVKRFGDISFIVGCGDLPYLYMEYVLNALTVPLYYVRGNHANKVEYGVGLSRDKPWGGIDIHCRTVRDVCTGTLLAGIEGSLRYNYGPHQYNQGDMWLMVFGLSLKLFINKIRYGRYLDIFVSHAPMWQVHDQDDLPHRGIKAFRWLVDVFKPAYHLHGHIHVYRCDMKTETQINNTRVINCYGYRELELQLADTRRFKGRILSKPKTGGVR